MPPTRRTFLPPWLSVTIAVLTMVTLALTVVSQSWGHLLTLGGVQQRSVAKAEHERMTRETERSHRRLLRTLKDEYDRTSVRYDKIDSHLRQLLLEVRGR